MSNNFCLIHDIDYDRYYDQGIFVKDYQFLEPGQFTLAYEKICKNKYEIVHQYTELGDIKTVIYQEDNSNVEDSRNSKSQSMGDYVSFSKFDNEKPYEISKLNRKKDINSKLTQNGNCESFNQESVLRFEEKPKRFTLDGFQVRSWPIGSPYYIECKDIGTQTDE